MNSNSLITAKRISETPLRTPCITARVPGTIQPISLASVPGSNHARRSPWSSRSSLTTSLTTAMLPSMRRATMRERDDLPIITQELHPGYV